MSLGASVIFGIGLILTISTDASAYYRGGSITVVSIVVVFTAAAITVSYALEWRQVLPSAPLRSVLLPPVLTTRHVTTRHAADCTLTHRATKAVAEPAGICARIFTAMIDLPTRKEGAQQSCARSAGPASHSF